MSKPHQASILILVTIILSISSLSSCGPAANRAAKEFAKRVSKTGLQQQSRVIPPQLHRPVNQELAKTWIRYRQEMVSYPIPS